MNNSIMNNNIRNTETGEWGLSVIDMRVHFAQAGRVAAVSDEFEGTFEQFESYTPTELPAFDPATHKAVQIEPADIDGVLTQRWTIKALTNDELDQAEANQQAQEQAEQEAARITVTKRQALLALFDLKGVKDSDIEAQIEQIEDEADRYRAMVDWQGSAAIESDSPTVLMLAAAMGLSAAELLQLFEYAATL